MCVNDALTCMATHSKVGVKFHMFNTAVNQVLCFLYITAEVSWKTSLVPGGGANGYV